MAVFPLPHGGGATSSARRVTTAEPRDSQPAGGSSAGAARCASSRPLARSVVSLSMALLLLGCGGSASEPDEETATAPSASAVPPDSIKKRVEREIDALDKMRESLASTIDTPAVEKTTFARVCKPVGRRAKRIAEAHGWTVRQLAKKYRNPTHAPDAQAKRLHEQFAESPERTDTWLRTVRDDTSGWLYARQITVRQGCIACHGPKEKRPDFVKKGYPDDRAYGFEPGDLRGIYTVFVPDPSAKENAP